MKIKENIKKTGVFWLPPFRESVPGTLSISNEEGIVLEVAQPLSADNIANIETLFSPNQAPLERIVGHIQEYGFVILDGCQSKTDSLNLNFGVMQTSRVIWADRFFTGFPQPQNEIPLFNTFTFSIEGVADWVGINGIKINNVPEERSITISYKLPESILLNLTGGMQLEIAFSAGKPDSLGPEEVGITQKTYLRLVTERSQKIDAFISVAEKLIGLLCFTINETVSMDSMSATSDQLFRDIGNGINIPADIILYEPSGLYSRNNPKINKNEMLFTFKDIQNDAERMINKWIKYNEQCDQAFNLYFTAQSKPQPSLEVKFLTLAQGLEVYHRKISGNEHEELWLAKRIEKLIQPFEEFVCLEPIDLIIKTRNYLTHYNPKLASKAAKGEDLYVLCQKMELLLELHFLKLMGFSEQKIKSIADKCPKLRWKRSSSLSER